MEVRKLTSLATCLISILLISSCGVNSHRVEQNGGNDQSGGGGDNSTIRITEPNNGISFSTKESASVTIAGVCEKGVDVDLVTVPSRPVNNNCAENGTWSFETGSLSGGPNTFSISGSNMTINVIAASMSIRADKTTISPDGVANLQAIYFDADNAQIVVSPIVSHHVTWTVTNGNAVVAYADNSAAGEKAFVTAGASTGSITVHAELDSIDDAYGYEGNTGYDITLTVANPTSPTSIPGIATSMTVTADKTTIDCTKESGGICTAKDIANLQIHFWTANGAEILISEVTTDHLITWAPDDPTIATVVATGTPSSGENAVVTGVGRGTTNITANLSFPPSSSYGYSGNLTANIPITVIGNSPLTELSDIASVSSNVYNVFTCPKHTICKAVDYIIAGVPYGTSKTAFEGELTRDDPNEGWNDSGIEATVQTGDQLIVTAQDGVTIVTYTVTVMAPPQATCDSPIDSSAKGFQAGSGTTGNPYLICTAAQLNLIGSDSTLCTQSFKLGKDIDLNGVTFNVICSSTFTGNFDGNGHIISNLSNVFIGTLRSGGLVENLGLVNINIIANSSSYYLSNYVGGLVAWNVGGTITNSYITGTLTATGSVIGGLVGYNNTGTITNSYSAVAVTGVNCTGGLVGVNEVNSTITNSYTTSTVNGSTYVGGLVGMNNGNIANSYATGVVIGSDGIGDLVGLNNGGTITNTYSIGAVTGDSNIGGLVGVNDGTINSSYWDMTTSGQPDLFDGRGTGDPTNRMKLGFYFVGWDFTTPIWCIQDGLSYPVLRWQLTDIEATNCTAPADFAPSTDDATLSTSSTVKGVAVTNLGTPNAILANAVAGSVTISSVEATDRSNAGNFITSFAPTSPRATVTKVVKYTAGTPTTTFATDTPYNGTDAIRLEDFFVVEVIAQDGITVLYYEITVMAIPALTFNPDNSDTVSFSPQYGNCYDLFWGQVPLPVIMTSSNPSAYIYYYYNGDMSCSYPNCDILDQPYENIYGYCGPDSGNCDISSELNWYFVYGGASLIWVYAQSCDSDGNNCGATTSAAYQCD